MLVRIATVSDARAISRVRVNSWRGGYAGIVPAAVLAAMSAEPSPRLLRRLEQPSPGQTIFVAQTAGAVIGFVNVGPYRVAQHPDKLAPGEGGEIYAIYVDPPHWGRGAGYALLSAATDFLRSEELTPIRLWVLADNARSRNFYERFGFTADGEAEPFVVDDGTVLDEVRYRLH